MPFDPHFFDRVRTQSIKTSAGPCDLPILYRDASLVTLAWRVDLDKARELVPTRACEPWPVLGKALALFCAFEYRDTTIGPYGEIGLGILTRKTGTKPSLVGFSRAPEHERDAGLWVVNLPVTTENARAAGVELWGYPKYVNEMSVRLRPREVKVTLEGELDITMKRRRGVRAKGIDFVTFSVNDERLLRTTIDVDSRVAWQSGRSARVTVVGDGPTAKSFRFLGLDRKKPMAAFCTDAMRSILPLGDDAGPVPERSSKSVGDGARVDAR